MTTLKYLRVVFEVYQYIYIPAYSLYGACYASFVSSSVPVGVVEWSSTFTYYRCRVVNTDAYVHRYKLAS